MNKCPKCGKLFDGKFCPECGTTAAGERLCPNCKAKVPGTSKFCPQCGNPLAQPVQPKAKKKSTSPSWVKKHKTFLIFISAILIFATIISVIVSFAIINRHNGTYYLYQYGEYVESKYYILEGNTYTDEKGYSCDVEFDGDHIKMYAELFGVKDVMAEGTISGDVIKLKILGAEVTYVKKGHQHKYEQKTVTEPTCTQEGTAVQVCQACGFYMNETIKLEPLGHDFQNQSCTRCNMSYAEFCALKLHYTLNKEKTGYIVSGIGDCENDVVIIPETYEGLPVTAIGDEAFSGCSGLTSITIPNSVTSIGASAFSGCSGLTSVTIGSGVTSIGWAAFSDCSGLKSVIWNAENCTEAGSYSWYIFPGCTNLSSVTFGENVKTIPAYAFSGCSGLTGELKIPGSVTSIGASAFSGCSGLTSVTISDGVTSIGASAFSGCSGLTSVDIPDNVTAIGEYAFYGCSGLTEITVDTNNSIYHAAGNCVIETKSKTLIVGCKTSHIPSDGSVTAIGKEAFDGCSGLTSVDIPDNVTSIGDYAFRGCSGLESVIWNAENCTKAGSSDHPIFAGCTKLSSVTFGENVKTIPAYAFSGCSGLTSVTIGSGVTSIGWRAFEDCSGLKEVHISDLVTWCNITFEDSPANPLRYHHLYLQSVEVKNLTIPSEIKEIKAYAFEGCSGLTSVTIPDSVSSIGDCAFEGCSGLTSVTIPDSVTSIGASAFYGCSGLTSVTIPDSVTSIGSYAFNGIRDTIKNQKNLLKRSLSRA